MQWVQKPVLVLNVTQINFWDTHQAEILKAVLNLSDGHIQMTFLVKSTKRIKAGNSPKRKQKKVYHKRWSPSTNNYIPRFKSDSCLNKSEARTRKGKNPWLVHLSSYSTKCVKCSWFKLGRCPIFFLHSYENVTFITKIHKYEWDESLPLK